MHPRNQFGLKLGAKILALLLQFVNQARIKCSVLSLQCTEYIYLENSINSCKKVKVNDRGQSEGQTGPTT